MSHVCTRPEPHTEHYHGYGRLCQGRAVRDLRCAGCGRLLGFTQRSQAVPAQCTDPWCAVQPPISSNEERDALMEHLIEIEGRTPSGVGALFGMTRQGAARVLSTRAWTPRHEVFR